MQDPPQAMFMKQTNKTQCQWNGEQRERKPTPTAAEEPTTAAQKFRIWPQIDSTRVAQTYQTLVPEGVGLGGVIATADGHFEKSQKAAGVAPSDNRGQPTPKLCGRLTSFQTISFNQRVLMSFPDTLVLSK